MLQTASDCSALNGKLSNLRHQVGFPPDPLGLNRLDHGCLSYAEKTVTVILLILTFLFYKVQHFIANITERLINAPVGYFSWLLLRNHLVFLLCKVLLDTFGCH